MAKKRDAESIADGATEAPAEKVTQRVAVERALAAGNDSPTDGVAYVKEVFGITLNNGSFSTIKSQIKKAGGTSVSSGKRGRPAGSDNGTAAHKPASNSPAVKSANPAELAMAVKALVKQHGADAIKQMVDVFVE